jgi:IS30 family transposase
MSRTAPKKANEKLMREVMTRIKLDHSPEQISGRLKLDYPDDPTMHVSTETIYQAVYARIRTSDPGLRNHLRQSRKKRRKRLSGKDRRGVIPNRTFIDERPAIVKDKSRIGDWEGDTIEGATKKGYVATFVDRTTKYLVAYRLKHKTTDALVAKAKQAFAKIPEDLKETCTVDNGKEFSAHAKLASAMGVTIYFAHPYHSWERGLNEHTNGLLRQYLPKNMPLDTLTANRLVYIVKRINNRPRKSLGYKTPNEAFAVASFALRI